jgi:hypothetical protein
MNAHDTNNLMFLMSMSTKQLKQWYMEVSEDDRVYAEELLAEAHLMAIDARVAQMQQFQEAQKVLARFAL